MKSELTPGWNVFKPLFHDHWDEFKQCDPRYDHAYYDELVNKMLACGNPDQVGYLEARVDGQCVGLLRGYRDLRKLPAWEWSGLPSTPYFEPSNGECDSPRIAVAL